MNFCKCKNRRLSQLIQTGQRLICRQCEMPVKCEVEDCESPATQIVVIYSVCDEHICEAETNYNLNAKEHD